jgi:hypothetical protein
VGGEEEEGEDSEPEVVPHFPEAQEALTKVSSFVYAHGNSDGDDSILRLERSFFELTHKVSTKQLSITITQELALLMKCCNYQ